MVGQVAKRQAITNPDRTVISIKREMGTNFKVNIDDKAYTPQEISAMILQKMKSDAEAFLGTKVNKAVITTRSVRLQRTPEKLPDLKFFVLSTSRQPLRLLTVWIRKLTRKL